MLVQTLAIIQGNLLFL